MSQVIGLLMLALSLLQAVRDNPSLPPAFRDQATAVALQAIAEASAYTASSTPQVSTTLSVGTTIPISMPDAQNTPTPLEVYMLTYEDGMKGYYYAGERELASASVNGNDAPISISRRIDDDCINIWKGGTIEKKVCGYWVARFVAPNETPVTLTAQDGSVYQGGTVGQ